VTPENDTPADDFLLFVYGTLMRGGPRFALLAGQRFLGEACTLPGYALYDLGPYPGLVRQEGGGAVHGEIYAVTAALRAVLDRVEGAPHLYRMREILLDGIRELVFAYFYQSDVSGVPQVADGRWDNRRAAPWDGSGL